MSPTYAWAGIAAIVVTATTGDVLQAHAMKQLGDLDAIRRSQGLTQVVRRVASSASFLLGLLFMALAFFSLLITLSWGEVSVVGPASASLTFIANAAAARIFLNEQVNARRWLAAGFVAGGVALLAR
jgi:drug/metabolite transporter (DMT)-like permease